ncbi:MAG: hypothetical protein U5Q44_05550 [Dehalococcoidia bacterium]|nr:hypothetical protein [Dehalococcoidia bacterium]
MLTALLLGLGTASAAADGEAGLVVDWGDGSTSNYCIAFQGNSISGEQLLARAGLNVNQFSGLVCGINGVGCQHSGTFNSCTCECQDLGGDCVYWSFFTKGYGGGWQYSAGGFQGQRVADGEMHAWRWGEGGPSSAPAPAPVSFEQVCGHPPRSVASPTPTPDGNPAAPDGNIAAPDGDPHEPPDEHSPAGNFDTDAPGRGHEHRHAVAFPFAGCNRYGHACG